jgi:plastocyanin
MADKCPKCGETLITRTIQKKLGLGSIDFPVAQICQKCNWSRDLTGASDIVVEPPSPYEAGTKKEKKPEVVGQAPEKPKYVPEKTTPPAGASRQKVPGINKILIIALAFLVLAGIIWAFIPKGAEQPGDIQPPPTLTPIVIETAKATTIATPEVTPTGVMIKVRIDRYKYINPQQKNLKIKTGDEVVWINDDSYSLTLVSKEALFAGKLLDNGKQTTPYLFKNTGNYTFDIVVLGVKKFSGTVVVEP